MKVIQWLSLNDSGRQCYSMPLNKMQCSAECGRCIGRASTFDVTECHLSFVLMAFLTLIWHVAETRTEEVSG